MLCMPDFASKINRLMTTRGLTQSELRDAIGRTVSHGTMSNWCSGRSLPRLDEAQKLAQALGVTVDFLADDSKETPESPPLVEVNERDVELLKIAKLLGHDRAMGRLLGIPRADDFGPLPSSR